MFLVNLLVLMFFVHWLYRAELKQTENKLLTINRFNHFSSKNAKNFLFQLLKCEDFMLLSEHEYNFNIIF